MMSVLTVGSSTMDYGVATIQAVAKVIHKDLVPVTVAAQRFTPTSQPTEAFPAVPAG
jgi:hypothetical protein